MRKISVSRKTTIILLTTYCLLLTTFLTGCIKKKINNAGSQGKNIICFGDSITFGYGVDTKETYPVALEKMTHKPVINAGLDGDTSTEAADRLESDVLSRDPYLVVIEFGGNDFLRKVPTKVTVDNIRIMVDKIQAKGAMVAIADISAGLLMRDYHSPYRKIAKEKGAIFIPSIMSGIITNPKMKSDFFHPNATGYQLIAERVYRHIKSYIK
ncbi:MAG: GDSL-type esterase/lipase family protein [Candidatus Omnitrophota bacterium]